MRSCGVSSTYFPPNEWLLPVLKFVNDTVPKPPHPSLRPRGRGKRRALLGGREDVYPRRFESRTTGKSGYAPACANEWVRGVCEKPKIKCAECPNRRFLPVTDEVVRWHLSGQDGQRRDFVMGVYPML